jgi:tRNA-Thr(GGU) m(6)t(6)A37 methyltransferase TsaA
MSHTDQMLERLRPIGHLVTPWETVEDCPRNIDPEGPECRLVVDSNYQPALLGLEEGQWILVLYWLGEGERDLLRQHPAHIGETRGTFALRSPHRPNPIGAAVLRIEAIADRVVTVRGLDAVNGTPLLDIKPALPRERPGEERTASGPPPSTTGGRRTLLAVDGVVNLLLGAALLLAPAGSLSWLGLPSPLPSLYAVVLGGVLVGIGLALLLEVRRQRSGFRGLGLGGAIVINLCGAGALLGWLVLARPELSPTGAIVLWTVAVVVLGLAIVELTSKA